MDQDKLYLKNQSIETAEMGEELGMLNVDTGKYYILDGVASDIFNALDTPKSLESLVTHLMQIYSVDHETCYEETSQFLDELLENALIKVVK